jgi:hypothetical protein
MTKSRLLLYTILAGLAASPAFAETLYLAQAGGIAWDSTADTHAAKIPVTTETRTRVITNTPAVTTIAPSSGTATARTTVITGHNPIGTVVGTTYPVVTTRGDTIIISEPPIANSETTTVTTTDTSGPYMHERTTTSSRTTGPTVISRSTTGAHVDAAVVTSPVDLSVRAETRTPKDRTNSPAHTDK